MKEGRRCTLGRLSFRSTSAATERLRLAPAKSLPRLTAALASSLLFLRLPKGIVTLLLGQWNGHMIWNLSIELGSPGLVPPHYLPGLLEGMEFRNKIDPA